MATILGLLLVVTFLATYLSTTLPSQMSVNDLNHDLLVENQVGRLSTMAGLLASTGVLGGQTFAPISLGSDADPPFAGADSAAIGPLSNHTGMTVSYTISTGTAYNPPTGGTAGNHVSCSGTVTATLISCGGATSGYYNAYSNNTAYTVVLSGTGAIRLNITGNGNSVAYTPSGTTALTLQVLGNNDTVTITLSGTSAPTTVIVVGNYDTISFSGGGGTGIRLLMVGVHDRVNYPATSGTTTISATFYGSSDSFVVGTTGGTSTFNAYFNGYNPASPSGTCPVDNLSKSDYVSSGATSGSTTLSSYFNGTYAGSGTNQSWTETYQVPAPFACPFFATMTQPFSTASVPGSGFVVSLRNTYAPSAEVAYDEGAVVFAQPGGAPEIVDPPPLALSTGVLSVMVPVFKGTIGSEAGTATAVVGLRLVADQSFAYPTAGYSLASGTNVVITIITPYAYAWMSYFKSHSSFASTTLTCTGANNVCSSSYAYEPGGPLGKIVMSVPSVISLTVTQAYFAVTLA